MHNWYILVLRPSDRTTKQLTQQRQANSSGSILLTDNVNSIDSLSASKLTHRVNRPTDESSSIQQHCANGPTATAAESSHRQLPVGILCCFI